MQTKTAQIHDAYQAFKQADDEWSACLTKAFGKRACDMRYTAHGETHPDCMAAYQRFKQTGDTWRQLIDESREEITKTTPHTPAQGDNMTQHTPGPWMVAPGWYEGKLYRKVHGTRNHSMYCLVGGDHNEANARLIAAAPAMLEALKEIEEVLECPGGAINPHWLRAHVAKAITQAEGRAGKTYRREEPAIRHDRQAHSVRELLDQLF